MMKKYLKNKTHEIIISNNALQLKGLLHIPDNANSIVLFAHGSGSGRLSPRNQFMAEQIQRSHIATLLFDLLTAKEEHIDEFTREFRFDISLLAERLTIATQWIRSQTLFQSYKIGYFGASTGAGAALLAAAYDKNIHAIVSRGGRPDLAGNALTLVKSPTLLIVGSKDDVVIQLNQSAYDKMSCTKEFILIDGATHLFEEAGALEQVAMLTRKWFAKFLIAANE